MKKQYVVDLKVGKPVDSVFVVSKKIVKQKKNGEDYCLVTLQDKGGDLQGIMWTEVFKRMEDFQEGDFVAVKGQVNEYNKTKQLVIDYLVKVKDESNIEYSDFIKTTKKNISGMLSELKNIIGSIENPYLKKLLNLFFQDEVFIKEFCHGTAAMKYHHAYRGGLLEHTLSVTRVCSLIAENYNNINKDLLVGGAILHDIGKIKEYDVGVIITVSDQGKLLGHISMGYSWIMDKIRSLERFPKDLAERLLHIILSHHGYKEFGSPVQPKILEAFVVHHVDYLDADVAGYNLLLEESDEEVDWSRFVKNFERSVLLRQINNEDYVEEKKIRRQKNGRIGQEGLF
ncbi:MAG: HD domain-containing protein [Candidatus Humimicrobiaceae bacterium]